MITITINSQTIKYETANQKSKNLLSILRENGFYVNAPCNGNGHCGKCAVTIENGFVPISEKDRKFFPENELSHGKRLACTCYPTKDLCISMDSVQDETDFEIVSDFDTNHYLVSDTTNLPENPDNFVAADTSCADNSFLASNQYAIAIDIGTTTIAAVLVDLTYGKQLAVSTRINHQRAYGSDVISRIQTANEGQLPALHASIVSDLLACISELLKAKRIEKPAKIVIGANTTMTHLLMEYSCETLGVYPFTPVNINLIQTKARDLLGADAPDCPLEILPGISTFVGGDIVSGIYATGLDQSQEPSFLIDLGTNGEIALGNQNKILVTSTAAGPAFEGGNISCGTGSILGAISDISIGDKKNTISLIGDSVSPTGICGTGVVAITAELLARKLIDDTGAFIDEYENGYPFALTGSGKELIFTQADVREIQLAKSAICAGIKILMQRYGVEADAIAHVYVAGGFGWKLNLKKALAIGLFPAELENQVTMIGNSCLRGLVKYLLTDSSNQNLISIIDNSKELSLSTDDQFNDLYIQNMYF
jgi:uncharacterized 2Fe-2S/4Fe-4S cluster protein (DUF4445 family)